MKQGMIMSRITLDEEVTVTDNFLKGRRDSGPDSAGRASSTKRRNYVETR